MIERRIGLKNLSQPLILTAQVDDAKLHWEAEINFHQAMQDDVRNILNFVHPSSTALISIMSKLSTTAIKFFNSSHL